MASGEARVAYERTGRRVQIFDRNAVARWHPAWEGNPRIARPHEAGIFERIVNGPGVRPYIREKWADRWVWNKDYRAPVGELFFSAAEAAFGAQHAPTIVIEPNLKAKASPNKQWGKSRWREFVALARERGLHLTQLGPAGTRIHDGVEHIVTTDFRLACAVLSNARAYVGHEGGLHHAAAALGVPGVVIFGGFIPVEITGYAIHRNLGVNTDSACGKRGTCGHCGSEMAKISPARVLAELEAILEEHRRRLAA